MKGLKLLCVYGLLGIAVGALIGCQPQPAVSSPTGGGAAAAPRTMLPPPRPTPGKSSAILVDKSVPNEVFLGEPLVYDITVQNVTKASLHDVIVVDYFPENFRFEEAMPQPRSIEGNKATWSLGSLEPKESKTIRVRGIPIADGMIKYNGEVKYESQPTKVRQARLGIEKVGPRKLFIGSGRMLTYVITVRNTGDAPARGVIVEDTVPMFCEFVSGSDGGRLADDKVKWELGSLEADAAKRLTITLRPLELGTATSKATIRADWSADVSTEITTQLEGIPAVALDILDEDPLEVGKAGTYKITAINQGTAPGSSLQIVCKLDDLVEYMGASGATGADVVGNTLTFGVLDKLEPGQKATWSVKVKALREGDSRFTVSLSSDQFKRPIEQTESTYLFK